MGKLRLPPQTTFKRYTAAEARQKQQEYEAQYGVKFDCYWTASGYHIAPVIAKTTPENSSAGSILLRFLTTEYVSFIDLAKAANMDLATVLAGAQFLLRKGLAYPAISRMGNANGLSKARK